MKLYAELKSTKNLDIHQDIFKYYADPTYLVKIRKLNRPLIEVFHSVTKAKLAIAVLDKHKNYLKLCLVVVQDDIKRKGVATKLLNLIKNIFNDEFMDCEILYTVCPHQFNTDAYQNLLVKSGFQLTTIKANGDLVYTYEKSI